MWPAGYTQQKNAAGLKEPGRAEKLLCPEG
jgi:hypothetical protein